MGTVLETNHFSSSTFSINELPNYQVIIDGTQSQDAYIVLYNSSDELVYSSSVQQFQSAFGVIAFSNLDSAKLRFLVPVIDSQVVPNELITGELKPTIHKYLLDDGVSPVLQTALTHLDAQLVYRENLTTLANLISMFPNADRIPFPKVYLEDLQRKSKNIYNKLVGVHVGKLVTTFGVMQGGSLLYVNDFQCSNINDFNFYLLKILELHAPNNQEVVFYLSGEISEEDPIHERIQKYASQLYFAEKLSCVSLVANSKA